MRIALVLVLVATASAAADPLGDCYDELDARHITYKKTKKSGIKKAVEITGTLGGVEVSGAEPLVIDCSLAVSLDEAGRYMKALGMESAHFASAYSRRMVRGTNHPSKHSYGLAIDVSSFTGPDLGTVRVDKDYEQGLGDAVDCVGQPLTQGGAILKVLQCQLVRSGLFHLVLSPDYDDAHHDHFHLEAIPWPDRSSLRSSSPAIH
ncbi:MAG TPA: extensin family protein [Kofleriaceae bacterium]|nr:extensin family protein [Kofleriaceae bacterium]